MLVAKELRLELDNVAVAVVDETIDVVALVKSRAPQTPLLTGAPTLDLR